MTLNTINWLRRLDLNQRPSSYEHDELPGCSTPHIIHKTHFHKLQALNSKLNEINAPVMKTRMIAGC